jgi:hypothetical protein
VLLVDSQKEGNESRYEQQNARHARREYLALVLVPCSKNVGGSTMRPMRVCSRPITGGRSDVRRDFSRLSSVRTTSMDFAIFGKLTHASSRIFRVGPGVSSWTRNSNLCSGMSSSWGKARRATDTASWEINHQLRFIFEKILPRNRNHLPRGKLRSVPLHIACLPFEARQVHKSRLQTASTRRLPGLT